METKANLFLTPHQSQRLYVAMFYPKSEIESHELAKAFPNDTIDYRKLVLKSYLREMDEAGLLGNQDGKSINLIRYLSLLRKWY